MRSAKFNVASALGLAFCGAFVGGNLAISHIAVPTLLLPSPLSALPAPANSENRKSPTATFSPRPVTKASHLARQWQNIFDIGSKAGPVAALLSSGSFLYAFRELPSSATFQRMLLVTAAGLVVSIVPFTFIVMSRTNNELRRRVSAASRDEEAGPLMDKQKGSVETYQTHDLVKWWASMNTM